MGLLGLFEYYLVEITGYFKDWKARKAKMKKNFKWSKIGGRRRKIFRNQFLGSLELKTLAIKK